MRSFHSLTAAKAANFLKTKLVRTSFIFRITQLIEQLIQKCNLFILSPVLNRM